METLGVLGLSAVPILMVLVAGAFFVSRYKRVPSNKILVIYGKVGKGQMARCIHGGGALVLPLIQDSTFLSLEPMNINIELKGAISKENIRVHVPASFMVAVSTTPEIMQNAAQRLLGLNSNGIATLAQDIIFGQLRNVIASMSINEINQDRDLLLSKVKELVDAELHKVGLQIVTVNIRDIDDESGYLKAIGQKAAEEAKNKALVEVAEQRKLGATGVAVRDKDREVTVSEQAAQTASGKQKAEAERRIQVAKLEADAIAGESAARAKMAETTAQLQVKQAEAERQGLVAKAEAERAILEAQKAAEIAKLEKEQLAQKEVQTRLAEAESQAEAVRIRTVAKAKADAILLEKQAEAQGIRAVLDAKAEGYNNLVKSLGSNAPTMLTIEQLPTLVQGQIDAMKNIKIDKLTVLDSPGSNGDSSMAHMVRGLVRSVPTFQEMAKNAGIALPEVFGTLVPEDKVLVNGSGSNGAKPLAN